MLANGLYVVLPWNVTQYALKSQLSIIFTVAYQSRWRNDKYLSSSLCVYDLQLRTQQHIIPVLECYVRRTWAPCLRPALTYTMMYTMCLNCGHSEHMKKVQSERHKLCFLWRLLQVVDFNDSRCGNTRPRMDNVNVPACWLTSGVTAPSLNISLIL